MELETKISQVIDTTLFNDDVAFFEKKALTEAKRLINRSSLLADDASEYEQAL